MSEETKIVTCVYCGHEYPIGTATSGAEILKGHILKCEKHPISKVVADKKILEDTLFTLLKVAPENRNRVWLDSMIGNLESDVANSELILKALRDTV